MSFLLDTDVCSAYLRGPGMLFHRFSQHAGQLHISVIAMGELYSWTLSRAASPKYQAGLMALLQVVGTPDLFIAATALVHDLTVVSHNMNDFSKVPGLRVVDWLAP